MATKQFYYALTDELRHGVATLTAAGLPVAAICTKLPITRNGVQAIRNEPGFQDLLEAKQIALTLLMRGDR